MKTKYLEHLSVMSKPFGSKQSKSTRSGILQWPHSSLDLIDGAILKDVALPNNLLQKIK